VVPHKADHDYRVIDNLNFPLFSADWGADEEILLLEAIELFGLGNWTEVCLFNLVLRAAFDLP
jgi:transcriptional adapter 2-alpha